MALALARERPELGKHRAARELSKRGVPVSPSGVRKIWQRHGLETAYRRLVALKRGQDAAPTALSDSQRALLERARVSRRMQARVPASASASGVRREELIAAAARVFSAKGYEGASLREICAAAGILPGSLYYHFRSKEDLYVTVHAEGFRQINALVDRALATEADPWRRFEAACAAHITQLVNDNDVGYVTASSLFQAARPPLKRRLRRERVAYDARFRDLIDALDLPRHVDRTMVRRFVFGMLNWTRAWYQPGEQEPAEIARQLVALIRRA